MTIYSSSHGDVKHATELSLHGNAYAVALTRVVGGGKLRRYNRSAYRPRHGKYANVSISQTNLEAYQYRVRVTSQNYRCNTNINILIRTISYIVNIDTNYEVLSIVL